MTIQKQASAAAMLATAALALVLTAPAAHARGGFLGKAINKVAPGVGTKLDKWHAKAGKPLDHAKNVAVGAVANSVVPGSGPAVTAALEAKTNRK
ncbi:hypothetical protein WHZ78_02395 [Bradyrhizobium symbiodeficiens]|uniref:hypothetical protein n=1 Tax=Bradyrhizobium symbiodeficiens TaxID=1404367 RepID=UPI0030CDAB3B